MCDSSSITELSRYRALPGGCCIGPPGPRGPTGQNPYINNTQYLFTDPTEPVLLYGGNNIIISGSTTAIDLPVNPDNISILYNCFKTGGNVNINGNGHGINAIAIPSTFLFSGGAYAYCTIIFDTVANIWIIHNN